MKTTEKNNRMIAEFMGQLFHNGNTFIPEHNRYIGFKNFSSFFKVSDLRYHELWNWLMPVVEKIEGMGFSVKIQRLKTSIHPLCEDKELFGIVCGDVSKKLEITYDTIVQFIEFYNEQK